MKRTLDVHLQVTPFSRWERELPKLIADERYQAIPNMKERKALFDDFCRTAASAKPAGKGAAAAKVNAKSGSKAAASIGAEAAAAAMEEGEMDTDEAEGADVHVAADGAVAKPDAEAAFRCV